MPGFGVPALRNPHPSASAAMIRLHHTFSIVARCPDTGHLGIAVCSAEPATGAVCPYLLAGAGAVSSQSFVNPYLAIDALEAVRKGMPAGEALSKAVDADPERRLRQAGIVDSQGRTAAHTGEDCTQWAGHLIGDGFTVQGNMLIGERVLQRMTEDFERTRGERFDERLMRALEAGNDAGGDVRGELSAAIRIMGREAYAEVDLRVDEHPEPVGELRRILLIARQEVFPAMAEMPRRHRPTG